MSTRFATRVIAALLFAAPAARAEARTSADTGWTIVIDVEERRVAVLGPQGETRYVMPAAVGSGKVLQHDDRSWKFDTPRGVAVVTKKEEKPLWIPPDWHYVEIAAGLGFRTDKLVFGQQRMLSDGRRLTIQGGYAGLMLGEDFYPLPVDEEIVFDSTLFIPPFGSKNRFVAGVLGPYRLVLSNGIGIHGTPFTDSIGKPVTHGCIRLRDEDITWLYENIPVGTTVIIR